MIWMEIYGIGALVAWAVAGFVAGWVGGRGDFPLVLFTGLFWPIMVPFFIGAALRKDGQ